MGAVYLQRRNLSEVRDIKMGEKKYKNTLNKMGCILCRIVSTACILNCIFLIFLSTIPELSRQELGNIMSYSILSGVFGGIFWMLSL